MTMNSVNCNPGEIFPPHQTIPRDPLFLPLFLFTRLFQHWLKSQKRHPKAAAPKSPERTSYQRLNRNRKNPPRWRRLANTLILPERLNLRQWHRPLRVFMWTRRRHRRSSSLCCRPGTLTCTSSFVKVVMAVVLMTIMIASTMCDFFQ